MKRASVYINVLPDMKDNAIASSLDEIRIVKTTLGPVESTGNNYIVWYGSDVFAKLDPVSFGVEFIDLILMSFPDTLIEIGINDFCLGGSLQREYVMNIIQLDDFLTEYEHQLISYETFDSVERIIDAYDIDTGEFNVDDDDPDCDDDDDDCDDEDEDLDSDDMDRLNAIAQAMGIKGGFDSESDEHVFGKKKNKYYGSSRVLKGSSKNPKKQFKRHGIIVSNNKSALKKDEKIIKAFLKDFIPGNSSWVKEYRQEVLSRWMKMYVIPRKVLKKLEKKKKSSSGKKDSNNKITKENAMNFTRKLLGNDSWNNPNK